MVVIRNGYFFEGFLSSGFSLSERMNLFALAYLFLISLSLNNSVDATTADSGKTEPMILISGPLSHRRRVIHRHPVRWYGHRRLRHHSLRRPKAFIQMMKIQERIVVDEHNRPKAAEAVLTNDLLQLTPGGGMKLLMHGEMHITPKKGIKHDLANARITEFGIDGKPKREGFVDRMIKRLHLTSFWPLFIFSLVCGFGFVGVIFVIAYSLLGLMEEQEYAPVLTDDALLSSIESAQPIQLRDDEMTTTESSRLI